MENEEQQDEYYAAASVVGLTEPEKLHMTITYMGRVPAPPSNFDEMLNDFVWDDIEESFYSIPLPFQIEFTRVIQVGLQNEITAIEVAVPDQEVEDAIKMFHYSHVDPLHISARHQVLHVTSKGYEKELLAARNYMVRHIYIKRRSDKKIVMERFSSDGLPPQAIQELRGVAMV